MTQAVVAGAIFLAALNLLPGLLGGWLWYDGDPSERAARSFWLLLRAAEGAALVLAIAVGSLAAAGHYSSDHLFYLYALLPLAIAFVAEQLRVTSAEAILEQRELADAQAVGRAAGGRAARRRARDRPPRDRHHGAVGSGRRLPRAESGRHRAWLLSSADRRATSTRRQKGRSRAQARRDGDARIGIAGRLPARAIYSAAHEA